MVAPRGLRDGWHLQKRTLSAFDRAHPVCSCYELRVADVASFQLLVRDKGLQFCLAANSKLRAYFYTEILAIGLARIESTFDSCLPSVLRNDVIDARRETRHPLMAARDRDVIDVSRVGQPMLFAQRSDSRIEALQDKVADGNTGWRSLNQHAIDRADCRDLRRDAGGKSSPRKRETYSLLSNRREEAADVPMKQRRV